MKIGTGIVILTLTLCSIGCKNKSKNSEETPQVFPAMSFIKSQVAHVDTGVYRIIKIVKKDGVSDTSYLKRELFREEAKDFLLLPDIASDKLETDYKETKLYDADLEQVSLSYTPRSEGEITRQEVFIKPSADGDKVNAFFFDRTISDGDSTVQKIMFWQVDKRFRIVTIVQKPGGSETTKTVDVIWNDFPAGQ